MQAELEISLPHVPASGTGARTHPSFLKREREGGPRLGESSQETYVGSEETEDHGEEEGPQVTPQAWVLVLGVTAGKRGASQLERDSVPESALKGFT